MTDAFPTKINNEWITITLEELNEKFNNATSAKEVKDLLEAMVLWAESKKDYELWLALDTRVKF